MDRYSKITDKRKREIVLLRGSGCVYKKCVFCDYHIDCDENDAENFQLNKTVLKRVTGEFKELEVINSGSVFELDNKTLKLIKQICKEKDIRTLHFESHYLYRNKIPDLRKDFAPVDLKLKLGLETFDYNLRENFMRKGIPERDPAVISKGFNEANLLFGIPTQTKESMERDIELGLKYFERICINVMCENTSSVLPDKNVIDIFLDKLYPKYAGDPRVDILINKTDFGVGD